jgi:chemotaxis-related protein WspD
MSPTVFNACWKTIGNFGDKSCPALKAHIRCLNCEVFHSAAATLLNRDAPEGYLETWTERIARPRLPKLADTRSVVIFRIGGEWLALPTSAFNEVVELRPLHTLPHRKDALVRGLVMVRGELLICISLPHLLGVEESASHAVSRQAGQSVYERMLVLSHHGERIVFSVHEVHVGVRYHPDNLKPVPATVAQSAVRYACGVLDWENHNVGVLDAELVFSVLNRLFANLS